MNAGLFLVCALISFRTAAAESDWYVEDEAVWKSRASVLETSFLVNVDGRLINPARSGQQAGTTIEVIKTPEQSLFKSVLKTVVNSISVSHETRLDTRRNALRVLDVLTNTDSKEKRVRLEFNTAMKSNSNVKYNGYLCDGGEVMMSGNSVPEKTHAIVLLAELPNSLALPFFLWGDRDARWPVSIREVGSSVRLSYEGVIKPGEKVALVHWVATAGLDKGVKLERTFDLFLKNGKLIEPMIEADVLPCVVNFKPESLTNSVTPDVIPASTKLVALDKLCEKLGIKRTDKDLLWMNKEEFFMGAVEAGKLNFIAGDNQLEIDWTDVAAVRGGGGRGRDQRLFLRNGSVWDGRVQFPRAKFIGSIGTMTLDGEALELLLGKAQPVDGIPADGTQGFFQTLNGRQFWVKESRVFPVKLISSFGELTLDPASIWLGQRKTESPYNQTITLLDGSRINGVLMETMITADIQGLGMQTLSVSELLRWGTMDAWRIDAATDPAKTTKAEPPSRYCWLRDGSFLVGTLTDIPLLLHANQEDIAIKSNEIARMTSIEGESSQVSVELLDGTKIKGRLLQDSVPWQLGKQVVTLPVGLITELVRKEKP